MTWQREKLIDQTLEQFHQTKVALGAATFSDWLHVDLTVSQIRAVFCFHCTGPGTVGSVAERLGIGLSAASHLVERLVQLELVERTDDPLDRRRARVLLTPRGTQLAVRLLEGNRSQFRALLERMETSDLEALHQGLAAMGAVSPVARIAAPSEQEVGNLATDNDTRHDGATLGTESNGPARLWQGRADEIGG